MNFLVGPVIHAVICLTYIKEEANLVGAKSYEALEKIVKGLGALHQDAIE